MQPLSRKSALCLLYFVALLWGSTGIWSQISTISSGQIVTGRTTIAVLALFLIVLTKGQLFDRKNWASPGWLFLAAIFLGLHWFCFFDCMRRSTVALGLVTYTTCPIFVAIAEPLLRRERIALVPLFCGILSLVGICFVHPITSFDVTSLVPVIIGIMSGLFLAVLALITRYRLQGVNALFISLVLNVAIAVFGWILAPLGSDAFTLKNFSALLGLGILCSAVGQGLFIFGMRSVDSRTASLITTLEAPSGVFLAWIILGEPVSFSTLIGCALVVLAAGIVSVKGSERSREAMVLETP